MREKTPAVSIALANEVLPPSDKERVIRRQISPPNTIHWKGKGLRTAESTAVQEEALDATAGLFDPVLVRLVAEGAKADLEQFGSAFLNPPRTLQCLKHQILFDVGHGRFQLDPFRREGDGHPSRPPTPIVPSPDLQLEDR